LGVNVERDLSRQGFLGESSSEIFRRTPVAVIGLGGGGSHIAQQLAHLGFCDQILVDDQCIENSNLNRLIGGTAADVANKTLKVEIAARTIKSINPSAVPELHATKWQLMQFGLRRARLIFGCVDSYSDREQLERFARRFGIAYIDIGMDVHSVGQRYAISGQVIVSISGKVCMRCMGFITDAKLKKEAGRYGDAGFNPQVVWPNGALASTAVGEAIRLLAPWTDRAPSLYLEYDGNAGTMAKSPRIDIVADKKCDHFNPEDVGDPYFDIAQVQLV
jgi:hypothetical protein